MISYIIICYVMIVGFNYLKIYKFNGFDYQSGKWKWRLNLPNVNLNQDEIVDAKRYKNHLFRVIFGVISFYAILLVVIELLWKINLFSFCVVVCCIIIDLIYFLHFRSKKQFIVKKDIL